MAQTIQQAVRALLDDLRAHEHWEGEELDVRGEGGGWQNVADYFENVDITDPAPPVTFNGELNTLDELFATFRLRGIDGDPEIFIPRSHWNAELDRTQEIHVEVRSATL